MHYENILTEVRGRVGIITLNRPQAMNALSNALVNEVGHALDGFEVDDSIGASSLPATKRRLPPALTSRRCAMPH
jgi:enoyl-CoA hydratase